MLHQLCAMLLSCEQSSSKDRSALWFAEQNALEAIVLITKHLKRLSWHDTLANPPTWRHCDGLAPT